MRTLIIAAQDAPLAQSIASTLAGAAGTGMWTTPLSSDGAEPATHYVSTGYVTEQFAAMCPLATYEYQQLDPDGPGVWVQTAYVPGDAALVSAACAQADPPLTVSVAQVEAIYSRADVTEQEPYVAFGRLGLRIVQEPLGD